MSGRNSRSVGLVDCSFVPSSPPSRDQLVRHIALRKKTEWQSQQDETFLTLPTTKYYSPRRFCSPLLSIFCWEPQCHRLHSTEAACFYSLCLVLLTLAQFYPVFREIHFMLLVSPHAPYIRVVLCFCFWV